MKVQLLLAGGIALFFSAMATASTMVGGLIAADTQWTVEGSPYVVTQTLLVVNDATLTIDPGVQVRFEPDVRLEIGDGELIARGTPGARIRFTANAPGPIQDADRWDAILFGDDAVDAQFDQDGLYVSGSVIEHAIVEYAGGGGNQGAVRMIGASPYISRSTIRYNSRGGLGIWSSYGTHVERNQIVDNTATDGAGVHLYSGNGVLFSGNTISRNIANRGGGLYVNGPDSMSLLGDRITQNSSGIYFSSNTARYPVLSADPENPTWIADNAGLALANYMSFTGSFDPAARGNIDARNVWWGTEDAGQIAAGIYDYLDGALRGVVLYQPFSVPEPASLCLLAIAGVLLARRRQSP